MLGLEAALGRVHLGHGEVQTFGSPRRLAVLVRSLERAQPDRESAQRGPPVAVAFDGPREDLEREHIRRVLSQLERQVGLNAHANQRCAVLAAKLSVLSAISEALEWFGE